MQNDMLKNTIAPWQEKGRWYHAVVSSDGTSWSVDTTKSDALFANSYITSNYLVINDTEIDSYKRHCNDVRFVFKGKSIGNVAIGGSNYLIYQGQTRQNVLLGLANTYSGEIDIYIFIN